MAEVIRLLGIWGQRWLEVGPQHLDPDVLMWAVFQHLEPSRLPPKRKVVRFEFEGVRKRYWLVLRRDDPDLCYTDPGYGDDLVVRAKLEAAVRLYLGELSRRRRETIKAAGHRRIAGAREPDGSVVSEEWVCRARATGELQPGHPVVRARRQGLPAAETARCARPRVSPSRCKASAGFA
jgi:hypothetical protein